MEKSKTKGQGHLLAGQVLLFLSLTGTEEPGDVFRFGSSSGTLSKLKITDIVIAHDVPMQSLKRLKEDEEPITSE